MKPHRTVHTDDPPVQGEGMPVQQWEYDDWVAQQAGLLASAAEPWRRELHALAGKRIFGAPVTFRDDFTDAELRLVAVAHASFQRFRPKLT